MLTEMRCATRTKSSKNASTPRFVVGGCAFGGSAIAGVAPATTNRRVEADSFKSIESSPGRPDRTIDKHSTAPINSDSLSSASFAAARSSFATAQEMESVRSPPREVSVVENDIPLVEAHEFLKATGECYSITTAIVNFRFRRLFLQQHATRVTGVRKRRPSGPRSQPQLVEGVIFGIALKSVLSAARVSPSKKGSLEAIRHLVEFLDPVGQAMDGVAPPDKEHLVNGLASHRIDRRQRAVLHDSRERKTERTFLGRTGLKDVAFGATAAVVCAHVLLSRCCTDPDRLIECLGFCLKRLHHLLKGWFVDCGSYTVELNHRSLRAEERAAARGLSAVADASRDALQRGLRPMDALQLHLFAVRSAVWMDGDCTGYPLSTPPSPRPIALSALPSDVDFDCAESESLCSSSQGRISWSPSSQNSFSSSASALSTATTEDWTWVGISVGSNLFSL